MLGSLEPMLGEFASHSGSAPALLAPGRTPLTARGLADQVASVVDVLTATRRRARRSGRDRPPQRTGDGVDLPRRRRHRRRSAAESRVHGRRARILLRRPRCGRGDRRPRGPGARPRRRPRARRLGARAPPPSPTAPRASAPSTDRRRGGAASDRRRPRPDDLALGAPHLGNDESTEASRADPREPRRLGPQHRHGAAAHGGRPRAEHDAALPHPRDRRRAARVALASVRAWCAPRGSTARPRPSGSRSSIRPGTRRCRRCIARCSTRSATDHCACRGCGSSDRRRPRCRVARSTTSSAPSGCR